MQTNHAVVLISWIVGWLVLLPGVSHSATERYVISPQRSSIQFQAYSLLVKPLGRFHTFSGDIVADDQRLSASAVRLVIDAASLDTDNAKRDKHLRSEDFFLSSAIPPSRLSPHPSPKMVRSTRYKAISRCVG